MNFPREYKTLGIPTWLLAIVIVIGIAMGILLMGPVGGVIWVAPVVLIAVFTLLWLLAPRTTVICTAEGFTFKQERRVGESSSAEGRWGDVAETEYFEQVVGVGKNRRVEHFFRVTTNTGGSMTIPATVGFQELIETFNAMTPQLPYVWQKQGMLKGFVGLDYEKKSRSQAAAV